MKYRIVGDTRSIERYLERIDRQLPARSAALEVDEPYVNRLVQVENEAIIETNLTKLPPWGRIEVYALADVADPATPDPVE